MRGVDQQPALQAVGDDRRGVDRQLEADHHALDADVADQVGQLGAQRLEVAAEPLADRPAALEQAVLLDRLDRRQPGPAGDRVAAERAGVRARLERLGDLRLWRSARPAATPPARALAQVRTSGSIPECW